MAKKHEMYQIIMPFIEGAISSGNTEVLFKILKENSNLPGRRGNLEMAHAFGDGINQIYNSDDADVIWNMLQEMIQISVEEAPVNSQGEFVVFCGYIGFGRIVNKNPEKINFVLDFYKIAARDNRWRIREAIAQGVEYFVFNLPEVTIESLSNWVFEDNFLLIRGGLAGLAIPRFLKINDYGRKFIDLLDHSVNFINSLSKDQRRDVNYKVLEKGLKFLISVGVAADPDYGFSKMKDWANNADIHLKRILTQNCKKARLLKKHPNHVKKIMEILD